MRLILRSGIPVENPSFHLGVCIFLPHMKPLNALRTLAGRMCLRCSWSRGHRAPTPAPCVCCGAHRSGAWSARARGSRTRSTWNSTLTSLAVSTGAGCCIVALLLLFLEEAGWAGAAPTPTAGADQPDAVRARGDALLFRVSLVQHDPAGTSVVASVALLGAARDAEIGVRAALAA